MKIDEIRTLLEKYQKGLCTAEERGAINEWYDSLRLENEGLKGEEVGRSLEKIRVNLQALTGVVSSAIPSSEVDSASEVDPASVVGVDPVTGVGPSEEFTRANRLAATRTAPVVRPHRWRHTVLIAAYAAIVASVFGWTWLLFYRQAPVRPMAALYSSDTTVITNRGETKQIVLADGSTIELNAGTEFRYPRKMSASARTATLVKGEAFFQITNDPARPFTVTSGKWRTTVLGTSFDIRAYKEESSTRIALLTGKVRVAEASNGSEACNGSGSANGLQAPPGSKDKDARSVLLDPRQLIRIDTATQKMQLDTFTYDYEVAAWKEGALHFKDASFTDIAFGIGNKYNVNLINKSKKQRWSYTGLFRSESLQEVLETICQTENLRYRFTDEGILILNKN